MPVKWIVLFYWISDKFVVSSRRDSRRIRQTHIYVSQPEYRDQTLPIDRAKKILGPDGRKWSAVSGQYEVSKKIVVIRKWNMHSMYIQIHLYLKVPVHDEMKQNNTFFVMLPNDSSELRRGALTSETYVADPHQLVFTWLLYCRRARRSGANRVTNNLATRLPNERSIWSNGYTDHVFSVQNETARSHPP